jgi:hypothetical protein
MVLFSKTVKFFSENFFSLRETHRTWENCLRLQCGGNNERTIAAEVKFNTEIHCKHICIFCKIMCWKFSVRYKADARVFQVF